MKKPLKIVTNPHGEEWHILVFKKEQREIVIILHRSISSKNCSGKKQLDWTMHDGQRWIYEVARKKN